MRILSYATHSFSRITCCLPSGVCEARPTRLVYSSLNRLNPSNYELAFITTPMTCCANYSAVYSS